MTRQILPDVALLSTLLLQATAQLLSCTDIHCPVRYGLAECHVDGTTLSEIGVANFSSSLSPYPLTWTIGLAGATDTNSTDQRRYYLSTPHGLDLDTRTDITGCAMFFVGVEDGLSFVTPNGTDVNLGTVSGTCADALGSACVADLTNQARDLAANSTTSGDFQCSNIALALQLSPPVSCTKAGTWGNITAKMITGSGIPSPLRLDGCVPTINSTYDVRSVATFLNIFHRPFANNITPLMTIFAPTGTATDVMASPEVALNCMKPMEDEPPNQLGPESGAGSLAVSNSWPSMLAALVGVLVTVVLMG